MNQYCIFLFKALRRCYVMLSSPFSCPYDRGLTNANEASEIIYNLLASGKPCMVARFGSTELNAIVNYCGVKAERYSVWKYITGRQSQWWWNELAMSQMQTHSGFFPVSEESIGRFAELMLEDMKQVDVLGSWLKNEKLFHDRMDREVRKVELLLLEPYWAKRPWSRILKGKRVLVVHPFAELIESQYKNKRKNLFQNEEVLPDFELKTIKAEQSLGGESEFKTWFEALAYMKAKMDETDYDIALIGCGAYGFPLAAHAKRCGKQAVHLGGALQLLFGIRGRRWDNPEYGRRLFGRNGEYSKLWNSSWIYPDDSFKPKNANKVEGGCYW